MLKCLVLLGLTLSPPTYHQSSTHLASGQSADVGLSGFLPLGGSLCQIRALCLLLLPFMSFPQLCSFSASSLPIAIRCNGMLVMELEVVVMVGVKENYGVFC